jgi:hypothetical protein
VFLRATVGPHPDNVALLRASAVAMTVMFALLVWVATSLALRTAEEVVGGATSHVASAAAAAVVSSAFVVATEPTIHAAGFFTQEAALIAFTSAMCLLAETRAASLTTTAALAFLSIAVTHTWYLLTPAVAPLILDYLARAGVTRRGRHLAVLLAAGPVVAFPVVTGSSPVKQLVTAGSAPFPSGSASALLVMLLVTGLLALRVSRANGKAATVLKIGCTSTGLLALGVAGYQLSAHALGYYTAKALVVFLAIGSLAAAAGVAAALTCLSDSRNAVLASTLLASATVLTLVSWPRFYALVSTTAVQQARAHEADAFLDRHPRGLPDGALAFAYDGCDYRQRILSQGFANLGVTWTEAVLRAEGEVHVNQPGAGIQRFAESAGTRSVEVYTSNACGAAVPGWLRQLPNVTVIQVGT